MAVNKDSELAQQDRAAERRVRADEWRDCKPTKHTEDKVHDSVTAFLATPESFPVVSMQKTLDDQHVKQQARRMSDVPEPITGFGELA